MSDPTPESRSGGNGFLWFMIGAILVAVLVIGYFLFAGQQDEADLGIQLDAPEAAAPEELPTPEPDDVPEPE